MNYLQVELKVCEGCGALWLRAKNTYGVYCRNCRSRLAEFPAAKGRRARLGPRKSRLVVQPVVASEAVVAGGVR